MNTLIDRIVLQPPKVRPGETVRVEVLGNRDAPSDTQLAEVSINGIPGAVQYLQFPTEGKRSLLVVATAADGTRQSQSTELEVSGAPLQFTSLRGQSDIAMLGVTQAADQAYEAILTLGSFIDTRSPPPKTTGHNTAPGRRGMDFKAVQMAQPKAATGLAGVLESAPKQALQVQSRRMTRLTTRRCDDSTAPGSGKSAALTPRATAQRVPVKAARRAVVSAIYDLGTMDVGALLGQGGATSAPKQEYEWDFGDGNTATTRTPTVRHDYFSAIDHQHGTGQFVVTCTAKHSGLRVQRSLTIHSAYTLCKRRGAIAPHVVSDLFAHKRQHLLSASFVVHNVEAEPMTLDRLSITPLSDDPDAAELPRQFVNLREPLVIAPKGSSMVGVNVPFVMGAPALGQLSYDVKGFTALYAGRCAGLPVRCSAVFDVPVVEWGVKPKAWSPGRLPDLYRDPWPWEMVEKTIDEIIQAGDLKEQPSKAIFDPQTGSMAVPLGTLGNVSTASRSRAVKILAAVHAPAQRAAIKYQLELNTKTLAASSRALESGMAAKRQKINTPMAPIPLFGGGQNMHFLIGGPPPVGPVIEGQICDPDNLDESQLDQADAGQLVCQLTDEVQDVTMPARWMNARKGDVLLSPGGDGIIGGLMLNVSPEQWYSHSGIMTRNYDEITHSTGSASRLTDHMRGVFDGSDGFEPQVLKYIWPGAITQTVENSINGEDFPDPEYDKTYSISAFGAHTVGVTHNDQMKMIPPLVLKPDPLQETPAVRTALHAIATSARDDAGRPGVTGKYHYRWYCYTDPTIGLSAPEGSDAGWAAGTRPSVCSSYIWMHAKGKSAHLETSQALVTPTDLETSDIATGATVRPITPDGLYTYTAAERLAAGEWLYNTIYNQAYEKAGWFGNLLTDGADDVANQFLNAFANDDADAKDSDKWKQVRDADAVSPDDMMWWDGPAQGGLYGFVEPAKYREPRVESYTVSRWRKVLTRGNIHGRVLANGQPVAGAMVQVFDGKTDFSDGPGHYDLTDVPFGSYQLKAQAVINGVLKSVQVPVNVSTADMTVDLNLQDPPERYRIAQVFIDFWGRDEESWPFDDEIDDPGPEYFELELGPDRLSNSASRTYHWGGEMRVVYTITVRLLVNNTIDVEVQGLLYEGTSEDTTDLDGTGSTTFQVGVGNTAGLTLTMTNTDEDAGDEGQLSISVKNVRNGA